MLAVTSKAKKKLKEVLLDQTTNPRIAFRITPISLKPAKFWLILDHEKEGDLIIENEGGRNILFANSSLAPELEGMVLDHNGIANN
jgi:Fe-S cluster assembly iron-binding protein IscA